MDIIIQHSPRHRWSFKRWWRSMRLIFVRFRYPFSLPQEVLSALGILASNEMDFAELLGHLGRLGFQPSTLYKYMPRSLAEGIFRQAGRREAFQREALFCYYFSEGWLTFRMQFDEQHRLRRLYFQHPSLVSEEGIEIQLSHKM